MQSFKAGHFRSRHSKYLLLVSTLALLIGCNGKASFPDLDRKAVVNRPNFNLVTPVDGWRHLSYQENSPLKTGGTVVKAVELWAQQENVVQRISRDGKLLRDLRCIGGVFTDYNVEYLPYTVARDDMPASNCLDSAGGAVIAAGRPLPAQFAAQSMTFNGRRATRFVMDNGLEVVIDPERGLPIKNGDIDYRYATDWEPSGAPPPSPDATTIQRFEYYHKLGAKEAAALIGVQELPDEIAGLRLAAALQFQSQNLDLPYTSVRWANGFGGPEVQIVVNRSKSPRGAPGGQLGISRAGPDLVYRAIENEARTSIFAPDGERLISALTTLRPNALKEAGDAAILNR